MRIVLALAFVAFAQDEKPKPKPRLTQAKKIEIQKMFVEYFKTPDAAILAELEKIDEEFAIAKADIENFARILATLIRQGTRLEIKPQGTEYVIDVPPKPVPKMPVFISLHGKGGRATNAPRVVFQPPHIAIYPGLVDQADGWTVEKEERWILELVEMAKRTYDVDTNRVYLTGMSMGGSGTWGVGCAHADVFAALAPVAGGLYPETLTANLRNTPIWISHGAQDTQVPPDRDRLCAKILGDLKYDVVYKEYPNLGHVWPRDDAPAMFLWMATKVRNPFPKQIVWNPTRAFQKIFFWIKAKPGKKGKIEARIEKDKIVVEGPVEEIFLNDKMGFLVGKEVVVERGGQEVFKGVLAYSLATLLESFEANRDPEVYFYARVKVGP